MPSFKYQSLNKDGKIKNGLCEAESIKSARQGLRSQNLTVLRIELADKRLKNQSTFFGWIKGWRNRLSIMDLSLLTRQFSILLGSGVSLEETVSSIADQSEKPSTKNIVLGIRSKLLEGFSLSQALSEYPKIFSHLYCASVSAGEKTGRLEKVLDRLADFVERRHKIRQQIVQAAVYPAIVTLAAITIVGFLLSFVVPKMIEVFVQSGQILPTPTRILLNVSAFIQQGWLYFCIALSLGLLLFRQLLKNQENQKNWHRFLLKMPLIGNTIKMINTARFSHTFAMLNQAGVEVLEAMQVAASTVNNLMIRNSLLTAAREIREGVAIHRALQKTTYFPPLSIQLIASGENSGQLSEMLERSAFTQENTIQTRINFILTLFEPVIILIMGSVVLFIVLAILLPIFDLNQLVG